MLRLAENFTLCFAAFLCAALTISAEQIDGTIFNSGNKLPVGQFMTDDGSVDLEAIRQSGYQGNLDLGGFNVMLDEQTGAPLLSPKSVGSDPDDQYWDALGSGVNGIVWALVTYNNMLIAGGDFTAAGGVNASKIASWDGSSWSPLGSGMNSSVRAFTNYSIYLIAGGYFTTACGGSANYIVVISDEPGVGWMTWPLGSGMGDYLPHVYALTNYDTKLIAGGWFSTAGEADASCIAAWDNVPYSWSALGSGMGGDYSCVYALTVYDNKLIAGGHFATAGGTTVNYIASWDGSSWSPLGSGMDSFVHALTVYEGKLIAGGDFMTAGGVAANRIAAWNGSSWSSLGSGVNGYVHALTVYDNQLIAGGEFTDAGETAASKIASWDGSSWSPLGSGMNNTVRTLALFDEELIVGGDFTTAGGKTAAHIAAWTKPLTDVSDDETPSLPAEYKLSQNCPNPFNSTTTIECSLPRRSHVVIDVYDLLGRRIKTVFDSEREAGKHTFFWDGTDHRGRTVGTGVYFYRIRAGDYIDSKKMLFLK